MFNLLIKSEISEVVLLVDVYKGFQGSWGFLKLIHQIFNALASSFGHNECCLAHLSDLINCQAQPGGLRYRCRGGRFTRISVFGYLSGHSRQAVGGLPADIPGWQETD
jgi:hypothetical protein